MGALGQAINKTLRDLLGDDFTPQVENAWNIVYGFMSSIMVESLRAAREAAARAEARCFDVGSTTSLPSRITDDVDARDLVLNVSQHDAAGLGLEASTADSDILGSGSARDSESWSHSAE